MSGYQEVKSHIYTKLKETNDKNIQLEIDNVKKILAVQAMHSLVFKIENISLTAQDWQRMQAELETDFNVKMEQGICIKGKEQ
jgi:hypothetical protein